MNATILLDGKPIAGDVYIGWAPRTVELTLSGIPAGQTNVTVKVSSTGSVGGLVFAKDIPSGPKDELTFTLTPANPKVTFLVCGKHGSASTGKNDAEMTISSTAPALTLKQAMTVRVRKNANKLTAAERDRFLLAYAKLNNSGMGLYQTFRDMHTDESSSNIHQGSHFLPWHRAFVLDIERELQQIDPVVAMPYWKFDKPASKVFKKNFMGATTETSPIVLAATNPLTAWKTDSTAGFAREFDPLRLPIASQSVTLALGSLFAQFEDMEGDPHGTAHMSFNGPINDIGTAVKDPLFFLLHCNVDRLWASWQYARNRYDQAAVASYPNGGQSGANQIATRRLDKMWPWDGVTGSPRPSTAPGGPMLASPHVTAPGPKPTIGSMIDYQGKVATANALGFDYDDVPFWK